MSRLEYNKEPNFHAYRKNALDALQKIASEANILPKQKNLLFRSKKKLIIDSPSYFPFKHSPSPPQQDYPHSNSTISFPQPSLQHSVILNSIETIDWPNDDNGWIVIKNADDDEGKFDITFLYLILNKSFSSRRYWIEI